jgi:predicted RNA-binding Zn-ribbon protein involved in translation (DUF1610 family)
MAYRCPRCGGEVQRGANAAAGVAGGAVGALLFAAFGSFQCKKCGTIPKREFPPEVQQQMTLGSVGLIVGAIVLVVVVLGILIALQATR